MVAPHSGGDYGRDRRRGLCDECLPWGENAEGGVFLLSFALGWFSITILSALFTKETHWWAAIPGVIMALVGGAVMMGGVALQTLEVVGDFWPLALIAGGAYLLWQRNR